MRTLDYDSAKASLVGRAAAAVTTAASAFLAWLALREADGVVPLGNDNYRTEFIDGSVLGFAWLLPIGVAIAAAARPSLALAAIVGTVLPQAVAAQVAVVRYRESGWADGLEVFAYLVPIGLCVLSVLSAAVGRGIARRSRQAAVPAQ